MDTLIENLSKTNTNVNRIELSSIFLKSIHNMLTVKNILMKNYFIQYVDFIQLSPQLNEMPKYKLYYYFNKKS